MSVYLDASALVALFVADPLSTQAQAAVANVSEDLVVSDYASLEFSASMRRFARTRMLSAKDARAAVQEFDAWTSATCWKAETTAADISSAVVFVRREDLALRSSDAVHVAIAHRIGARLLTFDKKLASNARRLGLAVV